MLLFGETEMHIFIGFKVKVHILKVESNSRGNSPFMATLLYVTIMPVSKFKVKCTLF